MATTDNTEIKETEVVKPELGASEPSLIEQDKVTNTGPDVTEGDELSDVNTDATTKGATDADKATASKKNTSDDFYDRFLERKEAADFAEDLQSADTYWNNRPEERLAYQQKFGDKAREEFDAQFNEIEKVWREKLADETDKVTLNERYKGLFGDTEDINYTPNTSFEAVQEIATGSRVLGDIMTDKQISDREAALKFKSYQNDAGEIVKLRDDEKWWKWGAGSGVEMNYDDPRHKSKDNRQISAFEYVDFPQDYRGPRYVKALYDGDPSSGELVSVWDASNTWLLQSNQLKGGFFRTIPQIAIRTPWNLGVDAVTGAIGILGSAAQLLDKVVDGDGENAFVDWANNQSNKYSSMKMSIHEQEQKHPYNANNIISLVANIFAQLYAAKGISLGVMGVNKLLRAGNPLMKGIAAAEAAGDLKKAATLTRQFEGMYGVASRRATLMGLTMMTGDSVSKEARQAGFGEDEVAAIYLSYMAAMLIANTMTVKMIEPYFDNAAAKPFVEDTIKSMIPGYASAKDDLSKLVMSNNMVQKIVKGVRALPEMVSEKLPKIAGHTPTALGIRSFMAKGTNEMIEEQAEWLGQEVVEHGASIVSGYWNRNEDTVPKYKMITDEGYWASELPNLIMSSFGGFVGGSMTHFLPGFSNENEHSFLVKGKQADRLLGIAITGGQPEATFLKSMESMKKSGALGSNVLSIKMNEKTGEYYKMTDPEAKDSISQGEASFKTIMNQFIHYKTLYGDGQHTIDEVKKLDPKLDNELDSEEGIGHVFHKQVTALHKKKLELLRTINPGIGVPAPVKAGKDANQPGKDAGKAGKKQVAAEDNVVAPVTPKAKPGITVEPAPEEDVVKQQKEYQDNLSKEVIDRASLMGTTDFLSVEKLIETERAIDDIMAGNAGIEQLALTVVGRLNLKAFGDKDSQKQIFQQYTDSTGAVKQSKFSSFGESLLRQIFTADTNLAKGHALLYQDYLKSADEVKGILGGKFSLQQLTSLALGAKRKPQSIAIDRHTNQTQALAARVDELIEELIPAADMGMLISAARTTLGLTKSTAYYKQALSDATENDEALLEVGEFLTPEQLEGYVDRHLPLLHKTALSTWLDEMIKQPKKLLVASVDLDQGRFRNEVLSELSKSNIPLTVVDTGHDKTKVEATKKVLDAIKSEIENMNPTAIKTAQDRYDYQKERNALIRKYETALTDYRNAVNDDKYFGNIDDVAVNAGVSTFNTFQSTAQLSNATPIIQARSEAITKAKQAIDDYRTIMANIAPVPPTVPKHGAVYNLLNEISITGNRVNSTIDKIIHPSFEDEWMTTESGTFQVDRPQSIIERLQNQVINRGTEDEEFRGLETANGLLDAIEVRIAQTEVIQYMIELLHIHQGYTKMHIPTGNSRYDAIPKFLSEYIVNGERLEELRKKSVLTEPEEDEYNEMIKRVQLLTDFNDPESVHAILLEAKEQVEELIAIGTKSQTSQARVKAYKNQVVNTFNSLKVALPKIFITLPKFKDDELQDAINNFVGVASSFHENDEESLARGKAALDEVWKAVYRLSDANKKIYLENCTSFSSMHPERHMFIAAMATDTQFFNKFYSALLEDSAKNPGRLIPTYQQEKMIREVYSFLTDDTEVYNQLPNVYTKNMILIKGGGGTGKTAVSGMAMSIAQQHLDIMVKNAFPTENAVPGAYNGIVYAAAYQHQADKLQSDVEKFGVRQSPKPTMDKKAFFDFLMNTDVKGFDNIGMIVFDEATFIQATSSEPGVESEIQLISARLAEINAARRVGLPPLKFVAIGDPDQGGWQEHMPTYSNPGVPGAKIDYTTLGDKSLITNANMMETEELKYVFRTLCEKVGEVREAMLDTAKQRFAQIYSSKVRTAKILVSNGIISNDPDGRIGGVKVSRSMNDIYNDESVISNIEKQIGLNKDFSVIIADDDLDSLDQIKAPALAALIKNNPTNFVLRTIESVQGGEADYILANLIKIMPELPITTSLGSNRMEKSAMAVGRARFFAYIAVSEGVNLENSENALITMLTPDKANELADLWNNFYVKKFWALSVDPIASAEKTAQPTKEGEVVTPPQDDDDEEQKAIEDLEEEVEELPKIEDEVIGTFDKPVTQHTSDIPVDQVVVRTTPIKTLEEADAEVLQNEAIKNNPLSTKKQIADAQANIDAAYKNAVEVVDLTGIAPVDLSTQSVENLIQQSDATIDAVEQNKALEKKGFIPIYLNLAPWSSADPVYTGLQYSADVFSHDLLKTNYGTPKTTGLDAVREAMKAFESDDRSVGSPFSKYTYSLVSYQTRVGNQEKVIHQVFAQRGTGPKVAVGMIPAEVLDTNMPLSKFLERRTKKVESFSKILTTLHSSNAAKPIIESLQGSGGFEFSESALEKINEAISLREDRESMVLPKNTAKTKFGRTALSDESVEYLRGDPEKNRGRKMIESHIPVGTVFMETQLSNPAKIFRVTSPGKPLRTSVASQENLATLRSAEADYILSLPTTHGEGFYNTKETTKIKQLRDKKTAITIDDVKQMSNLVIVDDKGVKKAIFKVKTPKATYLILGFKAQNKRELAFAATGSGEFTQIYGFTAEGEPIFETKVPSDDIEVAAYQYALGYNGILGKDLATEEAKPDSIVMTEDFNSMNTWLSWMYKYKSEAVKKGMSKEKLYDYMSKKSRDKRMMYFSDKEISLAELRELSKARPELQLSKPFIIMKTTKDGHQGKTGVLYTTNPKHKLNDPSYLAKITKNFSLNKPSQISDEDFNIKAYAREGIGVIMLDTKPTSLYELLVKYRAKANEDMNRSSSPVKSLANQRMVNFIQELTQIVFEMNPISLHSTTHARLSKMKFDGQEIFDEKGRTAIKAYLKNHPSFAALETLLTGVTADANLGSFNIAAYDETSPVLREFFEITDAGKKIEFFNDHLKGNSELASKLQKYGITETNLWAGQAGTEASGKVSGLVIINPKTRLPEITTDQAHAITFIPPGTLGTQGYSPLFHMLHFVQSINKLGKLKGSDQVADDIASLLDTLMTTYSKPGTLRRGVMWSGKVTTSITNIGISLLDSEYSEDMLTTKVKDIRMPAVFTNIARLINNSLDAEESIEIEKEEAPSTNVAPNGAPPAGTQTPPVVETFEQKRAKIIADVDIMAEQRAAHFVDFVGSLDAFEQLKKVSAQYIRQEFLKGKGLFNPDKLTTMIDEKLSEFYDKIEKYKPSLENEMNDEQLAYLTKEAKLPKSATREQWDAEITSAATIAWDNLLVSRDQYFIMLRNAIVADSALGDESRGYLAGRIDSLRSKLQVSDKVDWNNPGSILASINRTVPSLSEKGTKEQKAAMVKLATKLNANPEILNSEQTARLLSLHTMFTQPGTLDSKGLNDAQSVLAELTMISYTNPKLGFSQTEMMTLLEAFEILQAFPIADTTKKPCI
jgi:hypothetical protein